MDKIVMLFVCALFPMLAIAQEEIPQSEAKVTLPLAEYERDRNQLDSLKQALLLSNKQLERYKQELVEKEKLYWDTSKKVQTVNQEKSQLNDSIFSLKQEIVSLKKKVAEVDIVRLRYANGRLFFPYSQSKVQEAIEMFDAIADNEMRNKWLGVRELLVDYNTLANEVREVFETFQADPRRMGRVELEAWNNDVSVAIKNTRYYRHTQKSQTTIPHLDEIIKQAQNRLRKAKSTRENIDFSDFIERLQPTE